MRTDVPNVDASHAELLELLEEPVKVLALMNVVGAPLVVATRERLAGEHFYKDKSRGTLHYQYDL